jgi:hypothetical protein
MRADIHGGQEHKRSVRGPDTEAQDLFPPFLTSGLQRTAGPYRWVKSGKAQSEQMFSALPPKADVQSARFMSTRHK